MQIILLLLCLIFPNIGYNLLKYLLKLTASPILWTYYKKKDGRFPVKIRITSTDRGETSVKYINLDICVQKSQWTGSRVKNHPDAQEYNLKIINSCADLEKNFSLSGSASLKSDLYWWFNEYLTHSKAKNGYYHHKKLVNVKSILMKYRDKIYLKELDLKFIHDLETYLINKDYHVNYIADIMTRLKTLLGYIVKNGAIEFHKNPFVHYRIKQVKTIKERLSIKEIQLLEKCKLDGFQELARDMYLVSFYQGGVRFGDLCRLTEVNFPGRFIYTMHKSTVSKNMVLHPFVKKTMKKYDYKFPLNIDWNNEDQSINKANARMNKHLKLACKKSKIKEVTFHTSRHSIADYAIKMGLPDQQLQGILGHKLNHTTQVYKQSFYTEETDKAMETLFNKKPRRNGA